MCYSSFFLSFLLPYIIFYKQGGLKGYKREKLVNATPISVTTHCMPRIINMFGQYKISASTFFPPREREMWGQ